MANRLIYPGVWAIREITLFTFRRFRQNPQVHKPIHTFSQSDPTFVVLKSIRNGSFSETDLFAL